MVVDGALECVVVGGALECVVIWEPPLGLLLDDFGLELLALVVVRAVAVELVAGSVVTTPEFAFVVTAAGALVLLPHPAIASTTATAPVHASGRQTAAA